MGHEIVRGPGVLYRALKFGALATTSLHYIFYTDIRVPNVVLYFARHRPSGAITAAVAVGAVVIVAPMILRRARAPFLPGRVRADRRATLSVSVG